MANKYFVGTGNYNSNSCWSDTDGGSPGDSYPTLNDDIYFTSAFSGTLTINTSGLACRSITQTNFSGTIQHNGYTFNIGTTTSNPNGYALKLSPTSTFNYSSASASCINFVGTSATQLKIDTGGKTTGRVALSNAGNYILDTNGMTVDPATTFTLTAGTFDTNGLPMSTPTITCSGSTARVLTYTNSTWDVTGNSQTVINMSGTNLTVNKNGSTINLTYSGSTGTRTISTGNTTYAMNNFNVTAGTDTVSCSGIGAYDINFTGFSGTLAGSGTIGVSGGLVLSSSMTLTNTGSITFTTADSKTIDLNGKTLEVNCTFSHTGALTLASDFVAGVTRTCNLTSGTLDLNTHKFKTGLFANSNSGVRTLNIEDSILELTGVGTVYNGSTSTNLTLLATNSLVLISNSSATDKTFTGGGKTFGDLEFSSNSTGALIINSSNTFDDFKITNNSQTIKFQAGTTTTYNTDNIDGASGALNTLRSTTDGTRFNIVKLSDTINWDYLDIKDLNNTSTNSGYAGANSVNSGNNLRLSFEAMPSSLQDFFGDF